MSKEYNSALQARVEQFLKEKNISQAKAAPLMGISQTALSQYRRSMYDNGDIAALESKLEEFFRTQEEQEVNTEKALPYSLSSRIRAALVPFTSQKAFAARAARSGTQAWASAMMVGSSAVSTLPPANRSFPSTHTRETSLPRAL